jgi:hypothetical protein
MKNETLFITRFEMSYFGFYIVGDTLRIRKPVLMALYQQNTKLS